MRDRGEENIVRKVIWRRIRHRAEGVDVVGDVNAVIASSSGGPGSTVRTSSHQRVRVVQGPDGSEVVVDDGDADGEDGGVDPPR